MIRACHSAGLLPHFEVVVGHAFDFGVKVMALEVQSLTADSSLHPSVADLINLAVLANKSLNIEKRQEFAQPGMEQIFGIVPACGDIDILASLNLCRIGDQRIKRFTR